SRSGGFRTAGGGGGVKERKRTPMPACLQDGSDLRGWMFVSLFSHSPLSRFPERNTSQFPSSPRRSLLCFSQRHTGLVQTSLNRKNKSPTNLQSAVTTRMAIHSQRCASSPCTHRS